MCLVAPPPPHPSCYAFALLSPSLVSVPSPFALLFTIFGKPDRFNKNKNNNRYREFEALHKRLKEHPAFRDLGASLPAKRIFIHTHDVAFVNKRRLHLDGYLSQVMGVRELVATTDVWQFLSRDSEVYSAHDQDLQLLAARHAAAASAASSRSGSGAAAPGGGTKVRRRGSGGGGPPMPPVPPPLVRTSAGSFTTAALNGGHAVSDSIAALGLMSPGVYHTPPDSPLLAGGRPWVDSTTSQQQAAAAGRGQSGVSSSGAAAGGLGWGSTGSRPGTDGGLGAPPAGTHSRHQSAASLALFPSDAPAAGGSRGGSFLPPSLPSDSRLPDSASSLASASLSAPWDVPRGGGGGFGDDGGSVAGSGAGDVPPLDSESLLISTPLYDFVDVLFGLQSRGFFRRQVIAMARQLLSLVAGDAIEVYLSNQLKTITAEHTVARFILMLQGALWPGGVWYAWANQQVAPPPPPPTPPPAGKGHRRSLSGPKPRPAPVGLKPEAFLDAAKQPDEKEVARQLRDRLLASAPPALVRLLGQRCYNRSMQDLYDMLQSTTFTQQIGYSILELLLVGLFPELKPLVLSIQQEGGEGGGAAAAMAVARAASAMASAGAQQGL